MNAPSISEEREASVSSDANATVFSDANITPSSDVMNEAWDTSVKKEPRLRTSVDSPRGRRIKTEFLDLGRGSKGRNEDVERSGEKEKKKRDNKRRWKPTAEDYIKHNPNWSPRNSGGYAYQNTDRGIMPWDGIETEKERESSPRYSIEAKTQLTFHNRSNSRSKPISFHNRSDSRSKPISFHTRSDSRSKSSKSRSNRMK